MVQYRQKWLKMVQSVSKWFKMVKIDQKWSTNGQIWSKLDYLRPCWTISCHFRPCQTISNHFQSNQVNLNQILTDGHFPVDSRDATASKKHVPIGYMAMLAHCPHNAGPSNKYIESKKYKPINLTTHIVLYSYHWTSS